MGILSVPLFAPFLAVPRYATQITARHACLPRSLLPRIMDFTLVVAGVVFIALAVVWIKQLSGAKSSLPLPPNPKGLPVLGNLLDLAAGEVHVRCRDWSRQFGILLSLESVFCAHLCIFLNCRG